MVLLNGLWHLLLFREAYNQYPLAPGNLSLIIHAALCQVPSLPAMVSHSLLFCRSLGWSCWPSESGASSHLAPTSPLLLRTPQMLPMFSSEPAPPSSFLACLDALPPAVVAHGCWSWWVCHNPILPLFYLPKYKAGEGEIMLQATGKTLIFTDSNFSLDPHLILWKEEQLQIKSGTINPVPVSWGRWWQWIGQLTPIDLFYPHGRMSRVHFWTLRNLL